MEFSVRSKPATEFSERKWEGTPSKKLLDALEEKDSSEFLACMRKAINELQSKSKQKIELRKPDFKRERL